MSSPEQTDDQTAASLREDPEPEQVQDDAIRLGALVREVLADQAKASSPRKHPAAHLPLMAGAVGSAPYRPTPSLDPGVIMAIDGYDDETKGYVTCAIDAFSAATEGLKEISNARTLVSKNGALTADAKILVIADAAGKKQDKLLRTMQNALNTFNTGINALDSSLSKPLEEKAALGSINEEIRRHVKSLKDNERGAFINEAIEQKDTKSLSAILGAPGYLSGLDPVRVQHFTRRLHELQNPAVLKRLQVMKKARDLVESRGPLILVEIERSMNTTWHKVKNLKDKDDAAKLSLAKLFG